MKILKILAILFIIVSCNNISTTDDSPVVAEENNPILVTNVTPDCGTNPYILFDTEISNPDNKKSVALRFIKIVKEKEPEEIDISKINMAVERLNSDFSQHNFTFSAEDLVIIEDRKSYKEGIQFYDKHARIYSEVGFINVLIYPSSLDGGFSGAAVGIPSITIAVKEYYLPSSTISHEMGHALFGLFHTHTKDNTGKVSSWETGDFVCGTPYADFYATSSSGYIGRVTDDCEYIGPLGNLTQEEHNANIKNIMSYSISSCRKEFTDDQIDRGSFIIANSENHKKAISIVE